MNKNLLLIIIVGLLMIVPVGINNSILASKHVVQSIQKADQYVTINGIKIASGNLIANGKHGCKIGAPEDYGLYFQYGSLVGWPGGKNGDGKGAVTVIDVTKKNPYVTPKGYTGSQTWIEETFNEEPTSDNPSVGTGDPCRYYLGESWRLPTSAESKIIFNNAKSNELWKSKTMTNWSWQNDPAGAKYDDGTITFFLPASGSRNNETGEIGGIGHYGDYWSSTKIENDPRGAQWYFFSKDFLNPISNYTRNNGFVVRCVHQ